MLRGDTVIPRVDLPIFQDPARMKMPVNLSPELCLGVRMYRYVGQQKHVDHIVCPDVLEVGHVIFELVTVAREESLSISSNHKITHRRSNAPYDFVMRIFLNHRSFGYSYG